MKMGAGKAGCQSGVAWAARAAALAVAFTLVPSCSGGGGHDSADQSAPDGLTLPDARDIEAEDSEVGGDVPFSYPLPADPLPVPQNGTYVWSDGENKIEFAYNDSMLFLVEQSFSCTSLTGSKVKNDFLKITCNKAFEKGYVATLGAGIGQINNIKGKDALYCAISSTQTFDCVYDLLSYPNVCTKRFVFQAVWKNSGDCSEYAVPDCDPYTDANCLTGFNCIFGAGDQPVCMAAGEVKAGGECSMQGNCADGVCMALATDEKQHCYKYCKSNNDCPMVQCLDLEGKQYSVCSLPADQFEVCNILAQDCEDPNDGCYWSASTINKPICLTAGLGESGADCTKGNDCKKGYDCIAGKKCQKICNLTEGGTPACDSVFTNCSKHYLPQNAGYCGQ
jgi:hypothetical protein